MEIEFPLHESKAECCTQYACCDLGYEMCHDCNDGIAWCNNCHRRTSNHLCDLCTSHKCDYCDHETDNPEDTSCVYCLWDVTTKRCYVGHTECNVCLVCENNRDKQLCDCTSATLQQFLRKSMKPVM